MTELAVDLRPYGYAPGDYYIKCMSCLGTEVDADKRSNRCKSCAEREARKWGVQLELPF